MKQGIIHQIFKQQLNIIEHCLLIYRILLIQRKHFILILAIFIINQVINIHWLNSHSVEIKILRIHLIHRITHLKIRNQHNIKVIISSLHLQTTNNLGKKSMKKMMKMVKKI
jgi:hypothetical protein